MVGELGPGCPPALPSKTEYWEGGRPWVGEEESEPRRQQAGYVMLQLPYSDVAGPSASVSLCRAHQDGAGLGVGGAPKLVVMASTGQPG